MFSATVLFHHHIVLVVRRCLAHAPSGIPRLPCGVVMACMNASFSEAVAQLRYGAAVTIEF